VNLGEAAMRTDIPSRIVLFQALQGPSGKPMSKGVGAALLHVVVTCVGVSPVHIFPAECADNPECIKYTEEV